MYIENVKRLVNDILNLQYPGSSKYSLISEEETIYKKINEHIQLLAVDPPAQRELTRKRILRALGIIIERYGLINGQPMTYKALGIEHGCSQERIRQIVRWGIRWLRVNFKEVGYIRRENNGKHN